MMRFQPVATGDLRTFATVYERIDRPRTTGGTYRCINHLFDCWGKRLSTGNATYRDSFQTNEVVTDYIIVREEDGRLFALNQGVVMEDCYFNVGRVSRYNKQKFYMIIELKEWGNKHALVESGQISPVQGPDMIY